MYKIMFVCTGNICRSPTAEGVMRKFLERDGLTDKVEVASCGMIGYHVGEAPDPRTRKVAREHGYSLEPLRASQIQDSDFEEYDLILAMSEEHVEEMRGMAPPEHHDKIQLFLSLWDEAPTDEVPDPYYGVGDGFVLVLKMIEDCCEAILEKLKPMV